MNPILFRRLVSARGYIPPAAFGNIPNDSAESYASGVDLRDLNGGENGTNLFTIPWASNYADSTFGATNAPLQPDETSASLNLWVKADQITGVSDGGLLSLWEDQSENSFDFTASGAQRPTYNTNVQNGLPGVNFSSTLGVGMTGAYSHAAGTLSVMAVFRSNNALDFSNRRIVQGAANWGIFPVYIAAFNNAFIWGYQPDSRTHVAIFTQTSTGPVSKLYVDGGPVGRTTSAIAFPGLIHLGATGGFNHPANARIFEVAAWGDVLSDAEAYGVSLAMMNKWGI